MAACRSAFAVSTAACLSETTTRYGSLSSSARRSPLCTRLLSSTRTWEICPATRGATNVTCPFTNASSVEAVLSISSIQGMPNTRRTARTATPSTPARSFRFRVAFRASCGTDSGSVCADFASRAAEASPFAVGCASIEPGLLLCSVMSGTRCKGDETVGVERPRLVLTRKIPRPPVTVAAFFGGHPRRSTSSVARPVAQAVSNGEVIDYRRRGREQKCATWYRHGSTNPGREANDRFPG